MIEQPFRVAERTKNMVILYFVNYIANVTLLQIAKTPQCHFKIQFTFDKSNFNPYPSHFADSPEVTLRVDPERKVREGGSVALTCEAEANPNEITYR